MPPGSSPGHVAPTATFGAPTRVTALDTIRLTLTGAQVPGFPNATTFKAQFDCGEGLGYVLVEGATERARSQGVRHLYLVTDGAQGYFGEKLGFQALDRKDVVASIQATAEYALARSKNATWMRKEL